MAEIHKIKDLYVLKFHAKQQGLSSRDYIEKGRGMGLTDQQIIDSAYRSQSLERKSSIETRKKTARRLGASLCSIAAAYALNFSINAAIAKSSLPDGFEMRERVIAEIRSEIKTYENDISGLPLTDWRRLKLYGMYNELQRTDAMQDIDRLGYERRMRRAYNPLAFFD